MFRFPTGLFGELKLNSMKSKKVLFAAGPLTLPCGSALTVQTTFVFSPIYMRAELIPSPVLPRISGRFKTYWFPAWMLASEKVGSTALAARSGRQRACQPLLRYC